ncbi:unnamed protein product [Dovyalis caffra]|uniref:DAGKc domain-containing protein n=1 Tax=Dovyalis caffra TaxID=77055 RepID=A0AAV1SH35_9ROSI|nr:unnamed protein product [Dovyalis caffra]
MENQREGSSIVSDQVKVNGNLTPLTLTIEGKLWWMTEKGQRSLTVEKEVLGFIIQGSKLIIKAVTEKRDGICCLASAGGALARKNFVFELLSNESLRLWCQHLRDYINSLGRPKRLFIFVNPFGGKKSALKVFFDVVKPLLEDADFHAKEVVSTMDLTKYDGIVCVSGDGILVEVVNGLLEREDWKAAIKMPLGMVPADVSDAGTGNGMVKSTLDSVGEPCTASNAVVAIIRGHKCSLDVATILQGETKFFSVLMFAWGLVADIDIESEKYRWMGSARLDFYALQRMLHLRLYSGRISFVPAPGFEAYGEPTSYNGNNGEFTSTQNIVNPSQAQPDKVQQYGYQGPDVDLRNLEWRTIDGPFISVWLHNVPWGAEDTMAAPDAKLSLLFGPDTTDSLMCLVDVQFSDGNLDLILMKDCPKSGLLSLMTSLSNGGHVKSPHVIYLKVKAFILEPGQHTKDPTKGGIIDVDGEVLARGNGTYKHDQKTLMKYDKLQITNKDPTWKVYLSFKPFSSLVSHKWLAASMLDLVYLDIGNFAFTLGTVYRHIGRGTIGTLNDHTKEQKHSLPKLNYASDAWTLDKPGSQLENEHVWTTKAIEDEEYQLVSDSDGTCTGMVAGKVWGLEILGFLHVCEERR